MNRSVKTILFWLVIVVAGLLLWQVVRGTSEGRNPEISYSRFLSQVEVGNVEAVTIAGTQIQGFYRDDKGAFCLAGPSNPSLYLDELRNKGVDVRFRDVESSPLALQLLGTWAPLILLGVLWFYMIRYLKRARGLKPGETSSGGGTVGTSDGSGRVNSLAVERT